MYIFTVIYSQCRTESAGIHLSVNCSLTLQVDKVQWNDISSSPGLVLLEEFMVEAASRAAAL